MRTTWVLAPWKSDSCKGKKSKLTWISSVPDLQKTCTSYVKTCTKTFEKYFCYKSMYGANCCSSSLEDMSSSSPTSAVSICRRFKAFLDTFFLAMLTNYFLFLKICTCNFLFSVTFLKSIR